MSISEAFERDCPYYMSLGMTYDEYWYGDVWRSKAYLEAYKLKREQINTDAWLYGVYVSKAIEATICNAFREKNSQSQTYPNKPIPFYQKEEQQETESEKEKREEQEKLQAKLYMENMLRIGKNWGKKK